MSATSPAITRQATQLAATTTPQITANLTNRITRAFLETGPNRSIALDFNARLVTELRERRIWPERRKR